MYTLASKFGANVYISLQFTLATTYTYNFRTWKVKSWRPSVTSNGSFFSSIRFSLLLYQVWCWGMKWFWRTLNQVFCIWDRYLSRAGTRLRHYLHLEKIAQNLCNWKSKLKLMSMTDNTKTNNKHDQLYFRHQIYLSVIALLFRTLKLVVAYNSSESHQRGNYHTVSFMPSLGVRSPLFSPLISFPIWTRSKVLRS